MGQLARYGSTTNGKEILENLLRLDFHVLLPGGYSQKNWVGVCGLLPKTLTIFMTKVCDIPYPIYDLTFKSKPCF